MKKIMNKILLMTLLVSGMMGFSARADLGNLWQSVWNNTCAVISPTVAKTIVTFLAVISCTKGTEHFLYNAKDRTAFFTSTGRFLSNWYSDNSHNLVKHLVGAGILTMGLAIMCRDDNKKTDDRANKKDAGNKQKDKEKEKKKSDNCCK